MDCDQGVCRDNQNEDTNQGTEGSVEQNCKPKKDLLWLVLTSTNSVLGSTSVLLTGGLGPGFILSSSSIFPSSQGCTPPSLPGPRTSHVTFTTSAGLVATCGGQDERGTLTSCLVLEAGRWQKDPRVPDLPKGRFGATSVMVHGLGVLVMGGYDTAANTSVLLLNGGSSWEEGPVLPGKGAGGACSVAWRGSVLLIGGVGEWNQVREYVTLTGEWEEESKWPQLGGGGLTRHTWN